MAGTYVTSAWWHEVKLRDTVWHVGPVAVRRVRKLLYSVYFTLQIRNKFCCSTVLCSNVYCSHIGHCVVNCDACQWPVLALCYY